MIFLWFSCLLLRAKAATKLKIIGILGCLIDTFTCLLFYLILIEFLITFFILFGGFVVLKDQSTFLCVMKSGIFDGLWFDVLRMFSYNSFLIWKGHWEMFFHFCVASRGLVQSIFCAPKVFWKLRFSFAEIDIKAQS